MLSVFRIVRNTNSRFAWIQIMHLVVLQKILKSCFQEKLIWRTRRKWYRARFSLWIVWVGNAMSLNFYDNRFYSWCHNFCFNSRFPSSDLRLTCVYIFFLIYWENGQYPLVFLVFMRGCLLISVMLIWNGIFV